MEFIAMLIANIFKIILVCATVGVIISIPIFLVLAIIALKKKKENIAITFFILAIATLLFVIYMINYIFFIP